MERNNTSGSKTIFHVLSSMKNIDDKKLVVKSVSSENIISVFGPFFVERPIKFS